MTTSWKGTISPCDFWRLEVREKVILGGGGGWGIPFCTIGIFFSMTSSDLTILNQFTFQNNEKLKHPTMGDWLYNLEWKQPAEGSDSAIERMMWIWFNCHWRMWSEQKDMLQDDVYNKVPVRTHSWTYLYKKKLFPGRDLWVISFFFLLTCDFKDSLNEYKPVQE